MNSLHRGIIALSGHRLGWRAGGMPVLRLTTTGRRSGQQRSVMLTSPVQEGGAWVLVASKGGDDDHPAWYLNIVDDPNVTIETGPRTRVPASARVADSEERSRLWPQIVAAYANYGAYQQRTEREIPLVIVEPRPST